MVRQTLKHLTKLLNLLEGIGCGCDKGMGFGSIMVLANGMVHKLSEELKNDSALLLGLIFFAYLDLGGEYFFLLFCSSHFLFGAYISLL